MLSKNNQENCKKEQREVLESLQCIISIEVDGKVIYQRNNNNL